MWRKLLIVAGVLSLAFGILFLSIFRTASVKYDFGETLPLQSLQPEKNNIQIDYYLPYPGRVLPGSPLWTLKAVRDKAWLMFTTSPTRKAELKLLFADKRLGAALLLFDGGNPEEGVSTLTKAEKYLEEAMRQEGVARDRGIDTSDILLRLANASLKHYSLIQEIIEVVPDEARPIIKDSETYSKKTYEEARDALLEKGMMPPKNPFAW